MKAFMDENFLLKTEAARILYHEHAKKMPIIDYHCHVVVQDILDDRRYNNLTQVWLSGDHYKWRAMRLNGVEERYITGDASDYDKFLAYAATVSMAVGNPLYHWTHLELQRYFDIHDPLNEDTAPAIWDKTCAMLRGGMTVRRLIEMSNVRTLCSTDDPADDLHCHLALRDDRSFGVKVLPSFRPDQALDIRAAGFAAYIRRLSEAAGIPVTGLDSLQAALAARLDFFESAGCRVCDHAFSYVPYAPAEAGEVDRVLRRALAGEAVSQLEEEQYKTALLQFLGRQYFERGLIMQLHIGPIRRVNTRMTRLLGPDTGFDSIDDLNIARPLAGFLDSLHEQGMPKCILYCLNPKDNYTLATMLGNFAEGGVPGRMQFGSAWWFNDHIDGMELQMKTLASLGMLSRFVGMLTDSRSFTSYPRFEYFRRILCNILGQWMEDGEIAWDLERMGRMVEDICTNNIEKLMA